jgi:hypothetical protein
MDTPKTEVKEERFVVKSPEELIKHLSTEVETHTKMIFDWRARGAFYWLVGPFIAISSLVIVTKQVPNLHNLGFKGWSAAVVAGVCFIGMAILGGQMEAHHTDQCNTWRRTILRLTSEATGPLKKSDVVMEEQRVRTAYLVSHILLLVTFICVMVVLWQATISIPNTAAQPPAILAPVASPTASVKPCNSLK